MADLPACVRRGLCKADRRLALGAEDARQYIPQRRA